MSFAFINSGFQPQCRWISNPMLIEFTKTGMYRITTLEKERMIRSIISDELHESLKDNNQKKELSRLFPPGYLDKPEAEKDYQSMIHNELVTSHINALEILKGSLIKPEVKEQELMEIMRALNILRLSLGERINLFESFQEELAEADPNYDLWIIFQIIGQMLASVVDSLQQQI